ncbi:MAG TPA: serine/threonine-protein kinase [Polyangiaceae bacterium]|nr:serine/threonine-protein kinase [Polyangiaceae bacterium]
MPQNLPVPVGEIFAGKYRIDRVLGEGGMGVVVAAHHLELDQTVAIKFLLDSMKDGSREGAERFRREARAAAKIQSDHVVRVLDVGVLDSGERYMVMEYMDGRDLSDELQAVGSMSVPVAAGYILEALDAIAHAHVVGIVHRDLKPANLFLARRPDGSARIKVLDFGISKTFGQSSASELSLTKTSSWMGSPLYMSPEQMQSARDVDQRADIWSLGAILYELLTGRPPYLAESLPQLCNMLLTTDPEDVRLLRPDLPPELGTVIMRCLSRNVATRVQDAGELARALAPFATGPHAARISRLPSQLDRTELGGSLETLGGMARGSTTSGQRSSGDLAAVLAAETVAGHTAPIGAADSNKKSGRMLWVGAAALLLGLGAWFVLRPAPSASSEALAPTVQPVGEQPKAATSPAVPEVNRPAQVETAPTPPAAPAAPTAPAASAPAGMASAAPAAPAVTVKTSKPKSTTEEKKPTTTSDGDLSDFGGRR